MLPAFRSQIRNVGAEGHNKKLVCEMPNSPDILYQHAIYEYARGNLQATLQGFNRAILLGLRRAPVFYHRAVLFNRLGLFTEALVDHSRQISIDPGSGPPYSAALGVVIDIVKRAAAREAPIQTNIEIALAARLSLRARLVDPSNVEGLNNSGVYAESINDLDSAYILFKKSVAADPSTQLGLFNLAASYLSKNNLKNAFNFNAWAFQSSRSPVMALTSAFTAFLYGDYAKGWDLMELRWSAEDFVRSQGPEHEIVRRSRPSFSNRGSRRVLVWGEQGVGDEVMFGGLLREFRGLCGEMLVQVDRRLVGLFERSLPGVRFFVRGEVVDESLYDEQIPIGSLARYLRPSRESFVGRGGGYLRAKEGLRDYFRERIGVGSGERVIGLSWKSAAPETGAARSLGLEELVSALSSAGQKIRFVNLQYGDVEADIRGVRERLGIEVYSESEVDNREDLEGLAGLIEACDEVVSVGNATAHLAGALGKKTLVLLPYVAGWRWLHEGDRCPWYDSVTLLRQSKPGDWFSTLGKVSPLIAVAEGFD
jgi:hypothetical protein